MKFILLFLVFTFSFVKIYAQDSTKMFFYKNQDYGSESQFGHISVFTSIGFSVVGTDGFWGRKLNDIPYDEGVRDLYCSFRHPSQIKDYYGSYKKFFFTEFVPVLGIASYPNYAFHLIGEGMLSRKLYEYNISKH